VRKTTQLKQLLNSGQTEFILEAHNGLSARIVEEAGFKGIWGSGLALSAQHAVRDNNELSWTQVVGQLEFMTDVTNIPILLDGDTGYGDFNNMRIKRNLSLRPITACPRVSWKKRGSRVFGVPAWPCQLNMQSAITTNYPGPRWLDNWSS